VNDLGFSSHEVMSITDVPDEFVGTVENYRIERDENGINKLKFYINYNDKLVVVSYTRIYLGFIGEQLKKMGIMYLEDIKGKTFKFKRMPTPVKLKRKVNYNPRHVPISMVKTDVNELNESAEEEEEEEQEEEENPKIKAIKGKFKGN
jgi:hypothetical protein